MAISANIYQKCSPALGTNIQACGSITACNAAVITGDNIDDVFADAEGNFRVMDSLAGWQLEVKACGAAQYGMFDFLMANRVNWSKRVDAVKSSGLANIRPFVIARRQWPINNKYWTVTNGQANGEANWQVDVSSETGIPFDTRSFIVNDEVFITGASAAGSQTDTQWKIVSATALTATSGRLVLSSLNAGSYLDADKLESPVTGFLNRGINNTHKAESHCNQPPSYINQGRYAAWYQGMQFTSCTSQLYDEYAEMLRNGNNTYWQEFQDLPEAQINKQEGLDAQMRIADAIFRNKPLVNQTMNSYDQLEEIVTASSGSFNIPTGNKCIGRRANMVGILEQLAECDRVADLQGGTLNLPDLFRSLYLIMRSRQSNGDTGNMIDIFMDTATASRFHSAMLAYYDEQNSGLLRVNMDMGGGYKINNPAEIKKANWGFAYRSYPLEWPQGLVINVVTHFFFDDLVTQATASGNTSLGRNIWVLDFSGIYPFTVETVRAVTETNPQVLQGIDATYACTVQIYKEKKILNNFTMGVHVECPRASLIIENVGKEIPTITDDGSSVYPNDGSGVTTTPQD